MDATKMAILLLTLILGAQASKKRPVLSLSPESLAAYLENIHIDKKVKHDLEPIFSHLGHGGPYLPVREVTSQQREIEADHAPHYGILEYIDKVDNADSVPEPIRDFIAERKRLEKELDSTDFRKNSEKIKTLQKNINTITGEIRKVMRENYLTPDKQKMFFASAAKISTLLKDTVNIENKLNTEKDTSKHQTLEKQLQEKQREIGEIKNTNLELIKPFIKDGDNLKKVDQDKLLSYQAESYKLAAENRVLTKKLNAHNNKFRDAMGVLSVPYETHRAFPSTGATPLDDAIRALKHADAATTKSELDTRIMAWEKNMAEGIKKGYFKNAEDFATIDEHGVKTYDYQKVWESNFENILQLTDEAKSPKISKLTKKKINVMSPEQKARVYNIQYMGRLHSTYAKKFMTTAIYYLKTPKEGGGYARLMDLYLAEYKIYLKNDLDAYKQGMSSLIETNKKIGWLTDKDVDHLRTTNELAVGDKRNGDWEATEKSINDHTAKSKNDLISGEQSKKIPSTSASVCRADAARRRRSMSSASGCIFYTKKPPTDQDNSKPVDLDQNQSNGKKPIADTDDLSKVNVDLPSDGDTVSIDSKKLSAYLSQLDDGDLDSIRIKESMVEHSSKNLDKLTGFPEEIEKAKAIVKQETLYSHATQNQLASNVFQSDGKIVSPEALSKYQKAKVSTSKFAAKYSKLTSTSGKFSNAYGKVMLAKGLVTALRHGDYESLALMGGRIALEVPLKGLEKLGSHLAKKVATKTMGKVLGKIAGPIGDIADIGINVYSITKSAKVLRDPNASKWEQNEAIAEIVVDAVDIVITATAAVLSLVFPPLAPVFAVVAFAINLIATFALGLFKAANHVDSLNEQIPLLDFEKRTEYWRYVGGKDTSGYLQDLIAIKTANNIAVNLTVQFLVSNPDYIGRVFAAKTIYDPYSDCYLDERKRRKWLFFISGGWSDWNQVARCYGRGDYCDFPHRGTKCQADDESEINIPGPLIVILIAGSEETELRCRCGRVPPPVSGYDIIDNEVDFQTQRQVYLERGAPDFGLQSGFEYLCKPSSQRDLGKRYTNPFTNNEYYCKSAVAVRRKDGSGKFMLYDLGNGTDKVTLNDRETVDNFFVVADGLKTFYGNAGDDTFFLSGPCDNLTGLLDGKTFRDQGNSLVLYQTCAQSYTIHIDMVGRKLHFGQQVMVNNGLEIRNIQRVIGRKQH